MSLQRVEKRMAFFFKFNYSSLGVLLHRDLFFKKKTLSKSQKLQTQTTTTSRVQVKLLNLTGALPVKVHDIFVINPTTISQSDDPKENQ